MFEVYSWKKINVPNVFYPYQANVFYTPRKHQQIETFSDVLGDEDKEY